MSDNDLERDELLEGAIKQDQINKIRSLVPVPVTALNPEPCECGNSIQKERLALGYTACIGCAEIEWRKQQQYARKL
jgi:hypothetical protein